MGETFSGIELDKAVETLDLIRPLVPEGMSLADLAPRWILDHEAVSAVIAGVSRPDPALRNAAVSDLPPLGAEVKSTQAPNVNSVTAWGGAHLMDLEGSVSSAVKSTDALNRY